MKRPPTSASHRVFSNSMLLLAMLGANTVAGVLAQVLLTRILTVEQLGIYGTVFRLYSWLTALAVFLLPPVLVRFIAELKGQGDGRAMWRLLQAALAIQLAAVGVTVGGLIVWTHGAPPPWLTAPLLLILISAVGFYAFQQVLEAFLRGCQNFQPGLWGTLLGSAARIGGLALLLLVGGGVASAMGMLAVGNLVLLGAVAWGISRVRWPKAAPSPSAPRPAGQLRRRLLDYGSTMGVAGLCSLFVWNYVEIFFLNYFLADDPALEKQLAFYTLAIAMAMLPVRLGKVLSQALLPAFSELAGSGDQDRLRRGYHQATIFSTAAGVFCCALAAGLALPLFRVLFPAELLPAVAYFQFLLIPSAALSINHAGGAALPALDGHRFLLGTTAVLALITVLLNMLIIPRFGAGGAVAINVIVQTTAVLTGIWFVAVWRRCGFPMRRIGLLLGINAILAMALADLSSRLPHTWLADLLVLLAAGLAVPPAYLLLLKWLRIFSRQEREFLRRQAQRLPVIVRAPMEALV